MANPPSDYKDPYWTNLSKMMEKKHGLPTGLLVNIVQRGEKTNNDRESPVGAKTVYQIMPNTRSLFLKKYGVDAFESPQAAAEVAALHLKESLQRNKGNVGIAVREYHGGPNRSGWGEVNDAYVGRVLGGSDKKSWSDVEKQVGKSSTPQRRDSKLEIDALLKAYDKSKAKTTEAQQPKINKLSENDLLKAFDAKKATEPKTSSLPDFDDQGVIREDQPIEPTQPKPELSLGQKIVGAGEAALSAGTGAVGGILGTAGGALLGAGREIVAGEFGSPEAAQRIAQTASQGAQTLTYEPQTQGGQRIMQGVGQIAEDTGLTSLPPTLGGGIGTTTATLGRASIPAATVAARDVAQATKPAISQIVGAVKSGSSKAKSMIPNIGSKSDDGLAHMGSAQVPTADIRKQLFDEFDVPSTSAQVSRDQTELAEMYNTARKGGDAGRIVQNKLDEQQARLASAIDDIIESKDATSINGEEIGGNIKKVLGTQYQVERVKARKAYNNAISSEGSKLKIDMSQIPKWTNDQLSDAAANEINLSDKSAIELINDNLDLESTAFYRDAKKAAIRLGIADENADGKLIPKPSDKLPNAQAIEEWRQAINKNKKIDDKIHVTELKSVIDNVLDNSGGTAFKAARKNYSDFKNSWSNKAIISDLILNKNGLNAGDQKVINEKIIDRIISPSTSQNDLNFIKGMVEKSEGGKSAWNDMQASIMNRIRNEAYSGAQDSQGNNTLVFNKMDKIIKKLDGDTRRLDTLLGQEQAQKMRDANELARIIQTVPPNTGVNWSNTMTALAGLFDLMASSVTGIPAPVASILKLAISHIKDKKDVARAHKIVKNLEKDQKGKF